MTNDTLPRTSPPATVSGSSANRNAQTDEEWLAERAWHARLILRDCVEVNPGKHGGVPMLRGIRFPIASGFAEMSEGLDINEIAADFDLDKDMLKQLLEALAIHLDLPVAK
jgi:uncharacterized protein (DUF433 family)